MFADYLHERYGQENIVWDQGFISYEFIDSNTVFVNHLYVRPEFRRTNLGTELGDAVVKIAREKGCKYLIGGVDLNANLANEAILSFISYGMGVYKSDNEFIYFRKEI